jgi:hypothetical protein
MSTMGIIRSGTASGVPVDGSALVPVAFPAPFPEVPTIVLSPNLPAGASGIAPSPQATSVTRAGFSIFLTGGQSGAPVTVGWIALGPLPPPPVFNGIIGSIEFPNPPLQNVIPSYLYQEYSDDANLQAFVAVFNSISQGYLNWFNNTPLAVYTNPNVSGPLLDWTLNGIYGIERPVFSTLSSHFFSTALATFPMNTITLNGSRLTRSGTAIQANDDYYKRTATWLLYIGDGRICNAMVLRKRIARFLFGPNGTDITLSQAQNVSIAVETSPSLSFLITIPPSTAASYFQQAFEAGTLPFPFQLSATVVIS